jgi:hypothetical protein
MNNLEYQFLSCQNLLMGITLTFAKFILARSQMRSPPGIFAKFRVSRSPNAGCPQLETLAAQADKYCNLYTVYIALGDEDPTDAHRDTHVA